MLLLRSHPPALCPESPTALREASCSVKSLCLDACLLCSRDQGNNRLCFNLEPDHSIKSGDFLCRSTCTGNVDDKLVSGGNTLRGLRRQRISGL